MVEFRTYSQSKLDKIEKKLKAIWQGKFLSVFWMANELVNDQKANNRKL